MNYTKQRLQWLIADYKGDGATTQDEANLAQLVLDLVKIGNELCDEAETQDAFTDIESRSLIASWDRMTKDLH